MTTLRNYLLAFFFLTTVGLAAYLAKQQALVAKLQADSLSETERTALQNKITEAQKRQHEIEGELAALRAKSGKQTSDAEENSNTDPGAADASPMRGRGNRLANFEALMNDPEFSKLLALQQHGALDSSYAALFKQLGLTPAQLDQFKNLLVEKQNSMRDVLATAREQGLDPRADPAAFRQLVDQANAEIDGNIRSTLGDSAYAQYKSYEQTLPQRNVVGQLQQSLSYTNAPLTDDQANQLIQILASDAQPNNPNSFRALFGPQGAMMGGSQSRITNQDITQAQSVLSPAQVAALKQLQQQQQAQAQLQRLLRGQTRTSTSTGATAVSGSR